jgi:hypothetical protein
MNSPIQAPTLTPNGTNGRLPNGRFGVGNPGGPGNPQAKRVAALRRAMLKSVKPEDIEAVIVKLVELAKAGDTTAARELLDRVIGKAVQMDLLQRVEALEMLLTQKNCQVA